MQFESRESVEDDAEIEMKAAFDAHTCCVTLARI
jgi:hypothetical protein